MAAVRALVLAALFSSFIATCYGEVLFSTLPRTLTITTSPSGKVDLTAGVNQITATWGLNQSLENTDTSSYNTVKVKLCYHPESQKDRPWRKTEDHLNRDKTCQHAITSKPYSSSNNSITYTVLRDVPTADYFIRAYVDDATETAVAYGQSIGDTFSITAITGRHVSLDIASAVFSAFSLVSLAFFFYLEKKAKIAS